MSRAMDYLEGEVRVEMSELNPGLAAREYALLLDAYRFFLDRIGVARLIEEDRVEHALCERCWNDLYPTRGANRRQPGMLIGETCCSCGTDTHAGIYVAEAVGIFGFCRHAGRRDDGVPGALSDWS